jgi:hypothetical protein
MMVKIAPDLIHTQPENEVRSRQEIVPVTSAERKRKSARTLSGTFLFFSVVGFALADSEVRHAGTDYIQRGLERLRRLPVPGEQKLGGADRGPIPSRESDLEKLVRLLRGVFARHDFDLWRRLGALDPRQRDGRPVPDAS